MVFVPPHFYINWVKRALNRKSDPALALNGVADDAYRTAVMSFQTDTRIAPVTGKVDKATQDQLIRLNYSSPEYAGWVRSVLRVTNPQPMLGGGGTLNDTDKVEIMHFQENFGDRPDGKLTIDGWIGPQTEMVMRQSVQGDQPPPHVEFPADHVRGQRPGDQLEGEDIKAFTFYIIGRRPGTVSAMSITITMIKLGIAVWGGTGGGTTIGMPLNPWMLSDALSAGDRAIAAMDDLKGVAYAFMDRATYFARSSQDLNKPDLYAEEREATDAFKKGYMRMTMHLNNLHLRTNPALRSALLKLGSCPDQRLALRNIYDGLIEVYRTDDALANSQTLVTLRWCAFDYPHIKVRCGNSRPSRV